MAKFLSSTGIIAKVKSKQTINLLFESNWNDVLIKFGVFEEHKAIIVAVDGGGDVEVSKTFSAYVVETTNENNRDQAVTSFSASTDYNNEAIGFNTSEVATQDPREGLGFNTSEVATQDSQEGLGFNTSEVATQDSQEGLGFNTSEVATQDPREGLGFNTSEVATQDSQEGLGFNTSEVATQDSQEGLGFNTSEVATQDPREGLGFNTSEVAYDDTNEGFGFHSSVHSGRGYIEFGTTTIIESSDDLLNISLLGNRNLSYDSGVNDYENRLNSYNKFIDRSIINVTQFFGPSDIGTIDVNYSFINTGTRVQRALHDFQELKSFSVNVGPTFIDTDIAQYNVSEFFTEIETKSYNNFEFISIDIPYSQTNIKFAYNKQKNTTKTQEKQLNPIIDLSNFNRIPDTESTDSIGNYVQEYQYDIPDIVRNVISADYYDVLREVSPVTSFQKNLVDYVDISPRKDWRRSPFYSDYRSRHLIPNTNYELFNGIGNLYNPFNTTFDIKQEALKSNFFSSPNTGISTNTLWLRFVTKSYNISKERLHGRPYEHVETSGTEQEKWISGRTINGEKRFRWRGSNAFGHVIPKSSPKKNSHRLKQMEFVVQRKHHHTGYLVEYQTVNGELPGHVVEFEDIEHNLDGINNKLSKWEELWHPEWKEYDINWHFKISFGRLPECLQFDGENYIFGNVSDYDRFLITYQHEKWFEYYGHVVDDNYKDFDIAPVTDGLWETTTGKPDPDDPRKHTVQFTGFYPRQNLPKTVHLSFFILNNWSYDRDRFILNHEEPFYIDGKRVTPEIYLTTMKAKGFFEYNPFAAGVSDDINNRTIVEKTLNFEVIPPEKQMVGCTLGNTAQEREIIRKLFWKDGYDIPKPTATFRSCCSIDEIVGGN